MDRHYRIDKRMNSSELFIQSRAMLSLALIEDNQKLGKLTHELLTDRGFTVDRFCSAEEFFASAQIAIYHIYLIDVMLPGQS